MAPRADGTHLVPPEIIEKWGDVHGGGRANVISMWNASGANKDWYACSNTFVANFEIILENRGGESNRFYSGFGGSSVAPTCGGAIHQALPEKSSEHQ